MRAVRLCLLVLRMGVAICVTLRRARRQNWLGALAQTLAGGGDKDGTGAGDDRDDGDGDREDDDLLLRLAALCRGLGAQAVRGDAGRGRASRNLAHLLRSRGAAQVLLGIKFNGLIGAGGVVDGGVGNCVPEFGFRVGCVFRFEAAWESATRNPASEWDVLSFCGLWRKLRPRSRAQNGMHFPVEALKGNYVPCWTLILGCAFRS